MKGEKAEREAIKEFKPISKSVWIRRGEKKGNLS